MNIQRYLQRHLRIAIGCIFQFVLIRLLGETMASSVLKLGDAWKKHQADQSNSSND
jgi:hypothetical protein